MVKFIIAICLLVNLAGCLMYKDTAQTKKTTDLDNLDEQLGKRLEAKKGSNIFVEETIIQGESIRITKAIDVAIPGPSFIPFPVHFEPGELPLTKFTRAWKYYCAEKGNFNIHTNTLKQDGSTMDCVGIRISLNGADYSWVVDDKGYNKGFGDALWTLGIPHSERKEYTPVKINKPFKILTMSRIVFNGYYDTVLHFSYVESSALNGQSKEVGLRFEGKPEMVQINGYRFKIHSADEGSIQYENMGKVKTP